MRKTNYPTFLSPSYASHSDFVKHIMAHARRDGLKAFHVTILFKDAQTPSIAYDHLRRSLDFICRLLIRSNWRRAETRDAFIIYCFLDEPGSRYGNYESLSVGRNEVQDGLHYHAILLARPDLADMISNRVFKQPFEEKAPPTGKDERGGKTVKVPKATLVRSLYVQKIPDLSELELPAQYDGKRWRKFMATNPNAAYCIGEGPRKGMSLADK